VQEQGVLTGFYTPDTSHIIFTSPVVQIQMFDRPSCIASVTATGVTGTATTEVEVGDWDGAFFTADQTIGYVSSLVNQTRTAPVLYVVPANKAIRITTT